MWPPTLPLVATCSAGLISGLLSWVCYGSALWPSPTHFSPLPGLTKGPTLSPKSNTPKPPAKSSVPSPAGFLCSLPSPGAFLRDLLAAVLLSHLGFSFPLGPELQAAHTGTCSAPCWSLRLSSAGSSQRGTPLVPPYRIILLSAGVSSLFKASQAPPLWPGGN